MRKVMIATDRKFWSASLGAENRINSLLNYLVSTNHQVILMYAGYLTQEEILIIKKISNNIKIYYDEKSSITIKKYLKQKLKSTIWFLSKKINYIKEIVTLYKIKNTPTVTDLINKDYINLANKIISREKPDVILIEYINLAYLYLENKKVIDYDVKAIIDTLDVMSERYYRFNQARIPHWIKISYEEEQKILGDFDVIIGIQKKDSEKLIEMLPTKKIITVGYSCPIYKNNYVIRHNKNISILYIAGGSQENYEAIIDFINNVWGKIFDKFRGNVTLDLYGNVCKLIKDSDLKPGVNKWGFAKNIYDVYQKTDIVINPIKIGGGLKIKNVEALAFSKPLLTTPIGAEGLEEGVNNAFYIFNNHEDAFNKICLLIEDENQRLELAQKAYIFAEKNFSESVVYNDLLKVINS